LFFNNLVICHIESGASQRSLFSPHSTFSSLWTQFRASVDTTWTPRWTPKPPLQRQDKVYQINRSLGVRLPSHRHKKWELALDDLGSRFLLRNFQFPAWANRTMRFRLRRSPQLAGPLLLLGH